MPFNPPSFRPDLVFHQTPKPVGAVQPLRCNTQNPILAANLADSVSSADWCFFAGNDLQRFSGIGAENKENFAVYEADDAFLVCQ